MDVAQGSTFFDKSEIFIEEENNKVDIFKDVSTKLFNDGLVTQDFFYNLLDREKNYPTGIDLSVISSDLPNVAIPHTEAQFVNKKLIVPIKLKSKAKFNNMIKPDEKLSVSFLFMILNNDPGGQVNILSEIMDFINKTPHDQLSVFLNSEDTTYIYDFLINNFNK